MNDSPRANAQAPGVSLINEDGLRAVIQGTVQATVAEVLAQLNGDRTAGNGGPILLKPAEAARAFGISVRILWELTNSGEIASVNVGTGKARQFLRYLTEDLLSWARSRRGGPPPPAA